MKIKTILIIAGITIATLIVYKIISKPIVPKLPEAIAKMLPQV